MPIAPVTASLLGTFRSRLQNTPLSTATGSIDSLTLVHLLGTTPDEVRVVTRTVITAPASGMYQGPQVLSYNGSQVVVTLPQTGASSSNILMDVIAEFTYSMVR